MRWSRSYWPKEWQGVRHAQVFTGGTSPDGVNAKVLWAFFDRDAFDRAGGELVIEGENLSGDGQFRETFSAISYEGQEGARRTRRASTCPSRAAGGCG